jgi:predicted nucleic acid-binding Zn ribbon protein
MTGKEIPRSLGESLDRIASHLGAPTAGVLTTVFARWEQLVGVAVADHAWPVSLSKGVLVVGVDQPAWATQLRYLAPELVRKLGSALPEGTVERVEVKVQRARPDRP